MSSEINSASLGKSPIPYAPPNAPHSTDLRVERATAPLLDRKSLSDQIDQLTETIEKKHHSLALLREKYVNLGSVYPDKPGCYYAKDDLRLRIKSATLSLFSKESQILRLKIAFVKDTPQGQVLLGPLESLSALNDELLSLRRDPKVYIEEEEAGTRPDVDYIKASDRIKSVRYLKMVQEYAEGMGHLEQLEVLITEQDHWEEQLDEMDIALANIAKLSERKKGLAKARIEAKIEHLKSLLFQCKSLIHLKIQAKDANIESLEEIYQFEKRVLVLLEDAILLYEQNNQIAKMPHRSEQMNLHLERSRALASAKAGKYIQACADLENMRDLPG